MRILLDAHVSARRIAVRLREAGHDVIALSEERSLDGLDDSRVLELAAGERRIIVTFNIRDFVPLVREWAEARRSHSGCVLVHGLDHSRYGDILRGLDRLFRERPNAEDWQDVTIVLPAKTRTGPSKAKP